jgi:hypothetical protein
MATRPYLAHEQPGNPFALSRAPSPELLERAGAVRMARALRRAIGLRDDCSTAKAELLEAERAVKIAQARDRQAHARAITKSRSAVLEPAHTEEAERKVAALRRRHEALVVATEDAANAYYEAGEQEAEKAAEAAREQRQRSAAELRRAHEMVVAALDDYADLATAANATADPTSKRPRPPLRSAEVARIRNDRGLAWLEALANWLGAQQLAAEVEPDPGIHFGWCGGKQEQPPGSARAS